MFNRHLKFKKGFTLIEMLTAISIFAIVAVISVGTILSVFNVNNKAQTVKSVLDNLNLAIESIAREMRFGTHYDCGPTLPTALPPPTQNCPPGSNSMAFLSNDQTQTIVYRQNGTSIEKSRDRGVTFTRVTAPEIVINDLKFYVLGATPLSLGDTAQPKVLIKISGTAGSSTSTQTSFIIQTLVSQRQLDK